MSKAKKIIVSCPHCKKDFSYYESEFRPFCSERCKQIDLGHWLEENYAVPSNSPLSEEDIETIIEKKDFDE